MTADRLMVVENLETFRDIGAYEWLPIAALDVLVVWRGGLGLSPGDSAALVAAWPEPVWGFFDFDPAGLGLATGLPRLERLLLPPEEWLKGHAAGDRPRALYADSLAQWGPTLEAAGHRDVRQAWELMKNLRAGVLQEAMRQMHL